MTKKEPSDQCLCQCHRPGSERGARNIAYISCEHCQAKEGKLNVGIGEIACCAAQDIIGECGKTCECMGCKEPKLKEASLKNRHRGKDLAKELGRWEQTFEAMWLKGVGEDHLVPRLKIMKFMRRMLHASRKEERAKVLELIEGMNADECKCQYATENCDCAGYDEALEELSSKLKKL